LNHLLKAFISKKKDKAEAEEGQEAEDQPQDEDDDSNKPITFKEFAKKQLVEQITADERMRVAKRNDKKGKN